MATDDKRPNYSFFSNTACEYFPCHRTDHPDDFNCLFCFCPLYALGPDCGGNMQYTENGIKDCSNCMIPHSPGGYDYILSKFDQLAELARKKEQPPEETRSGEDRA